MTNDVVGFEQPGSGVLSSVIYRDLIYSNKKPDLHKASKWGSNLGNQ